MTQTIKIFKDLLPTTLSGLTRVAVADVQAVVAMPDHYTLDMGVYHAKPERGAQVCAVCMAGAVLARTVGISPSISIPGSCALSMAVDHDKPFHAINEIRIGAVAFANEYMTSHKWSTLSETEQVAIRGASALINYNYDRALQHAPWEIYLQAADILEQARL